MIPAIASLVFLLQSFPKAAHKKDKRYPKPRLTFALFASCTCWIFFWSFSYYFRFSMIFPRNLLRELLICLFASKHFDYQDVQNFLKTFSIRAELFPTISSVMNPVCLILVCKTFWTPAIRLYSLVLTPFRRIWSHCHPCRVP